MTGKPTIYIICGVHNGIDYTKKLLDSITKQTYKSIKTIIIDDKSTDGTFEYLQKKYSEIIVLKGSGNLWWTGAIYAGVEEVLKQAKKDDYIFTVNNDCVIDQHCLENLLQTSIDNNRAIAGSLIIDSYDKQTIIDAGVKIDWSKGKYISLGPKSIKDLPFEKKIEDQINTLSTKGTLYPVEVFQKIGNFDKRHLPHYISDYEFACRAKKAEIPLLLSYFARIYNDRKRTGFGESLPARMFLKEYCLLLFSRKSRLNIIDQYWFITLCCPPKFLLRNYFLIVAKFFYLSSYVFPLNLVRKIFIKK